MIWKYNYYYFLGGFSDSSSVPFNNRSSSYLCPSPYSSGILGHFPKVFEFRLLRHKLPVPIISKIFFAPNVIRSSLFFLGIHSWRVPSMVQRFPRFFIFTPSAEHLFYKTILGTKSRHKDTTTNYCSVIFKWLFFPNGNKLSLDEFYWTQITPVNERDIFDNRSFTSTRVAFEMVILCSCSSGNSYNWIELVIEKKKNPPLSNS